MKILISLKEAAEICDYVDLSAVLKMTTEKLESLPGDEILVLSVEDAEQLKLIFAYDPFS